MPLLDFASLNPYLMDPAAMMQAPGGMAPQDETSLAETMQPRGEEPDMYEVLSQLFAQFAPQFAPPSDEWRKRSRREALGMFGAGMLQGRDLQEGLGMGFEAYGNSRYKGREDEQTRLDLRAREEALSKYRGASTMTRGYGSRVQEDVSVVMQDMLETWGHDPEYKSWILAAAGSLAAMKSVLRKIVEIEGRSETAEKLPRERVGEGGLYRESSYGAEDYALVPGTEGMGRQPRQPYGQISGFEYDPETDTSKRVVKQIGDEVDPETFTTSGTNLGDDELTFTAGLGQLNAIYKSKLVGMLSEKELADINKAIRYGETTEAQEVKKYAAKMLNVDPLYLTDYEAIAFFRQLEQGGVSEIPASEY